MRLDELKVLYSYGHWANRRLFPVISLMTPDQFIQPFGGKHSSIRDVMVHIVSAEWGWLDRCGGAKRGSALQPADYTSIAQVLETCDRVETYVHEFLSQLSDNDLTRSIEYTLTGDMWHSLPLGILMQHAAIHGIHHRGQVALMLQLLGNTLEDWDFPLYYAEQHGIRTW